MDFEFIECFKKPIKWLPTIGRFNKPYHSIQLISIGIVSEDGRKYYAVSRDYNFSDASQWVKDNVITKIYQQQSPTFKQHVHDIDRVHKALEEYQLKQVKEKNT